VSIHGRSDDQRLLACQRLTLRHGAGHSKDNDADSSAFSNENGSTGCARSPERTSLGHISLITGKIQGNIAVLTLFGLNVLE